MILLQKKCYNSSLTLQAAAVTLSYTMFLMTEATILSQTVKMQQHYGKPRIPALHSQVNLRRFIYTGWVEQLSKQSDCTSSLAPASALYTWTLTEQFHDRRALKQLPVAWTQEVHPEI